MQCKCNICGKEYEYSRKRGHSFHICNNCRQNYRKKLLKKKAIEYKGEKCQICGYDKCENSLTFHHLDPSEKEFTISERYNLSWEKLKKELDKCILLCANCHGEEHAKGQYTLEEYEKWIIPLEVRIKNKNKKIKDINNDKLNLAKEYKVDVDVLKKVRLSRRKVERPTKDQFYKELEELNFNKTAMGRKYGVSEKTIRQWIEIYEKYGM